MKTEIFHDFPHENCCVPFKRLVPEPPRIPPRLGATWQPRPEGLENSREILHHMPDHWIINDNYMGNHSRIMLDTVYLCISNDFSSG